MQTHTYTFVPILLPWPSLPPYHNRNIIAHKRTPTSPSKWARQYPALGTQTSVCVRMRSSAAVAAAMKCSHKFCMVHAACSNGNASVARSCLLAVFAAAAAFPPPCALPHFARLPPRKPFFFIPFVCMREQESAHAESAQNK